MWGGQGGSGGEACFAWRAGRRCAPSSTAPPASGGCPPQELPRLLCQEMSYEGYEEGWGGLWRGTAALRHLLAVRPARWDKAGARVGAAGSSRRWKLRQGFFVPLRLRAPPVDTRGNVQSPVMRPQALVPCTPSAPAPDTLHHRQQEGNTIGGQGNRETEPHSICLCAVRQAAAASLARWAATRRALDAASSAPTCVVCAPQLCRVRVERRVHVGVCQQRLDGLQDGLHAVGGCREQAAGGWEGAPRCAVEVGPGARARQAGAGSSIQQPHCAACSLPAQPPAAVCNPLTRPLVFEDVQADVSVGVDVGVEAGGLKAHRRRLEGVLAGEAQRQAVGAALVGGGVGALEAGRGEAGGGGLARRHGLPAAGSAGASVCSSSTPPLPCFCLGAAAARSKFLPVCKACCAAQPQQRHRTQPLAAGPSARLRLTLMVPTQSNSESPAGKADTPSPLLAIRPMSSCCSRLVTAPVSTGRAASGAPPLAGLAAVRAAVFIAAACC